MNRCCLGAGIPDAEVLAPGEEQLLPMQSEPSDEALLTRPKNKSYQLQQGIFEQVSEHIRREPGTEYAFDEAWIGTSEGEECNGNSDAVSGAEAMRQNPLLLTPESGFVPADIPGLRKAAILMVAIGDELAKKLFQSLSENDVRRVTEEITRAGEMSLHRS